MIVAVDAATGHYTGLAVFDGDCDPVLHRVKCFSGDWERTYLERIRPITLEVLATPGPHTVAVERPPPTANKNQGPRIGQAAIGYPIGYLSGLVVHDFVVAGHEVLKVDVSPWRDTMLSVAARCGIDPTPKLPKSTMLPLVRNLRNQLVATWSTCDHRQVTTLEDLQNGRLKTCPICVGELIDKTDRWKATACNFVRQQWPKAYAPILAAAKANADKAHLDHRYAGVADACEAACIGLHVRELTAPVPAPLRGPARSGP